MAGNWRNMDKSMDDMTPRRAIAAFLENATPHDSPDPEILHQVCPLCICHEKYVKPQLFLAAGIGRAALAGSVPNTTLFAG